MSDTEREAFEAPDYEAIGWAVTKLTAFGVANNTLDNALMMDRLEAMLKFPARRSTEAPQLTDEQILIIAAKTLPMWIRQHPESEPEDALAFARAILKGAA